MKLALIALFAFSFGFLMGNVNGFSMFLARENIRLQKELRKALNL